MSTTSQMHSTLLIFVLPVKCCIIKHEIEKCTQHGQLECAEEVSRLVNRKCSWEGVHGIMPHWGGNLNCGSKLNPNLLVVLLSCSFLSGFRHLNNP